MFSTGPDYPFSLKKAGLHFKTISQHKLLVMKHCFACGLYTQGVLHDLTKYSPTEFLRGACYFQGTRSPNDAERRDKGGSVAWIHHKGRNKHHFEYWTDYQIGAEPGMYGVSMPNRYILEMFCDRVAACEVYAQGHFTNSMPLDYFNRKNMEPLMHPETARKLKKLLELYRDYGEESFVMVKEALRAHRCYL